MHNRTLSKTIAVLALVGFIGLLAPGLSSAEKKSTRFDFRSLIRKPAAWVSAVWNWVVPIFDLGNSTVSKSPLPTTSPLKARPTGDLASPRPSRND